MNAQITHYDAFISPFEQPKCPLCGGWMHIRISPAIDMAEWSCLQSDCLGKVATVAPKHIAAIAAQGVTVK